MLALTVTSCSKDGDSDEPQSKSKKVKYEITGNYTGQFTVVYSKASGSNESLTVSKLPWSAEIALTSFPAGVGLGIAAVTGKPGVAGQTAKATIYVDGVLVETATQTSGVEGYIFSIPSLAHVIK